MSCSIYIPIACILDKKDRVEITTSLVSMINGHVAEGNQLTSRKCMHRILHSYVLHIRKGWILPVVPDTDYAPMVQCVDDQLLLGVTYSGLHSTCVKLCTRYRLNQRSILMPDSK